MKSRFIAMLVLIALVCGGWTLGWNYMSGKAEAFVAQVIDRANAGDQQLTCDNKRTSGFPFRMALRCDNTTYAKTGEFEVQLAGVNAQAFVYRPMHQVVDFTSPARIKAGRLGTIEVTWKQARIGSQLQTDGLNAATVKLQDARARLLDAKPELANAVLKADSALASARVASDKEPKNAVVFGAVAKGLAMLGSKYTLPAVDMQASVLMNDIAPAFAGKGKPLPLWIESGGEGKLVGLSLVSGNAELFAKGWFQLDNRGFWNGDFDVDSVDLNDFVKAMGPELVQIQAISRAVIGAMESFGSRVELNGRPASRVTFKIRKGFVSIGLIPLGNIPKMDLSRFR